MSPLRVILCVDGAPPEALLEVAVPLLAESAVWVPTHVVDARGRRDLGSLRRSVTGAGPLSHGQQQAIEVASAEHTREVLGAAEASLLRLGLAQEPPQIRTGEPGREICRVVAEVGAALVVLFSSRHTRAPAGPGSVGHTARFVLDHAACPVLLVRRG